MNTGSTSISMPSISGGMSCELTIASSSSFKGRSTQGNWRAVHPASLLLHSKPFFFLFVKSIIPSWFFSDRVECDIRQRPSMWEGIHGPNMNILLLAIFEYKFPDRIIFECVFAQLPYLIRIPKVTLAELESGGKWFHHSYNRRRNPDKAQVSKDEEDKPIYSLHVGLSTWGYISGCTYVY